MSKNESVKEINNISRAIKLPMKFILPCTFRMPDLVLSQALFRFFITLSISLSFTFSVSAHAGKVLLLGDSLSAAYNIPWESGWAQLLADEMPGQHQLINASVSGETTGGGITRLQSLLDEHQPQWVIIELGGNDGLRGYPLKVIRNNLKQLGSMALKTGAKPVYFGIQIPPNYGKRYNDAFAALFEEVAAEVNAPYLNLFIEEIASNPHMMQEDKLHPSELAQPLIKEHISKFLNSVLTQ